MKIYDLICRFCGTKFGEIGNLDGIEDNRCTNCSDLYGDFKEMENYFAKKIGGTHDEFLKVMKKAEYKKPFLEVEIEKIKKAKKSQTIKNDTI